MLLAVGDPFAGMGSTQHHLALLGRLRDRLGDGDPTISPLIRLDTPLCGVVQRFRSLSWRSVFAQVGVLFW